MPYSRLLNELDVVWLFGAPFSPAPPLPLLLPMAFDIGASVVRWSMGNLWVVDVDDDEAEANGGTEACLYDANGSLVLLLMAY